jgi:hypothetical protein
MGARQAAIVRAGSVVGAADVSRDEIGYSERILLGGEMKPKTRAILAGCIENGIARGYKRAHKHTDNPNEVDMINELYDAIWLEIDEFFSFEDEVTE